MKVLVLGGGGREAALVWKLHQSPRVSQVFCAPGNAGIAQHAKCVEADLKRPEKLAQLALELGIDLTICGPEVSLVAGAADAFARHRLKFVGPSRAAAQLEGSKVFSKEFMSRHHIPTAMFSVCDSVEAAEDILTNNFHGFPIVIKADGLAAGKGVVIAQDLAEARAAVQMMMVEKKLGEAGSRILLEECLTGHETSFLIFTDGRTIRPLPPARDYKRIFDHDEGPNTGGMGSVSAPGLLDEYLQGKLLRKIAEPTLAALQAEGIVYRGVLYIGLMLTEAGPRVLEYNVRLGDPETQVLLPRLKTDLVDICEAIADGTLDQLNIEWSDEAAVCVVMASGGYPNTYTPDQPISGLKDACQVSGVHVFHAGTSRDDLTGKYLTAGGRVLGVTATGQTVATARERAYTAVSKIQFSGQQFRQDIALE
ncbi:MAG: phosphoribosylamine--glycine ligase [Blastocatellia bacterium]|nr:phosphoribosylamine--glycine ligase [Blastocatellia bacterium]